MNILIVGSSEDYQIGAHFYRATQVANIKSNIFDVSWAYQGNYFLKKIWWNLLNRRPIQLKNFSSMLVSFCHANSITHLISTGISPICKNDLVKLKSNGVCTANYLTDDPFNDKHRASWFFSSLTQYQYVFSTRKANLEDLKKIGCSSVHYIPFGYDPQVHYPDNSTAFEGENIDVLFAGGGDSDRLPYIRMLASKGLKVALYGGYWDRY